MMTLQEIQKLSDDELRIKVAELCGWVRKTGNWNYHNTSTCTHRQEVGMENAREWWHLPGRHHGSSGTDVLKDDRLPNYPRDLNAMHEAEGGLTDKQYDRYCDALWNQCDGATGKRGAVHSTARQRAEAFVMVMQKEKE